MIHSAVKVTHTRAPYHLTYHDIAVLLYYSVLYAISSCIALIIVMDCYVLYGDDDLYRITILASG